MALHKSTGYEGLLSSMCVEVQMCTFVRLMSWNGGDKVAGTCKDCKSGIMAGLISHIHAGTCISRINILANSGMDTFPKNVEEIRRRRGRNEEFWPKYLS